MPCNLLHMVEQPDPAAYDDPDLKDLVGQYPRLFCAHCAPPRTLKPSESIQCLGRQGPCWKRTERVCAPTTVPSPWETPLV